MGDSDYEIFDANFRLPERSSTNAIDMATTVQEPESVDSERPATPLKPGPRSLRSNSCVNVNRIQLNGDSSIEDVCKLVCKPVCVGVTKLSVSELTEMCPRRLRRSTIVQRSGEMEKDIKVPVSRTRRSAAKRTGEVKRRASKRNAQRRNSTPEEQMPSDPKEDAKNCININQPYIKLQRIDEVINKIAQTFAKVIPNRDIKAEILPQRVEKSNAELKEEILQALPLSIDENECRNEAESLVIDCNVNENLQTHQFDRNSSDQSCNDELQVNNQRRKLKRSIDVVSDSEGINGSDAREKSQKIFPEAKRLKLDSIRNTLQISVINEEPDMHNDLEESVINTEFNTEESLPQMNELTEEVNCPDESCEPSKEQNSEAVDQNTDVATQSSDVSSIESQKIDFAVEEVEEDWASNCVPSETDFTDTTESNTCSQLEDNGSATAEEPLPETNELQEVAQKTSISEKDLAKEYNLFRELSVLLIKLDSIKASSANKYSAGEIEQLTDDYIDSILDSKFLLVPREPLSHPVKLERSPEPEFVESLNENNSSNTRAPIESVQSISEKMWSSLDRSSSLSAMEQVKIQEKKRSEKQYVTRSLTEFVANNSLKEMVEDVVCEKLESPSAATVSSTLKKSTDNSPDGFSGMGNTVSARKLKIISNSILKIKSTGEVLNPREKISKQLFRNENSERAATDVVSSGITETEKRKKFVSTILALKSNLKDERMQGSSGKKIRLFKLHKLHKVDGRKNTVSNSISPMKHNTYKCIVCNLCFEDYSSLQQHLTTHTQKQSSTPSEKNPVARKQQDKTSLESKTLDNIQEKPSKSQSTKKNKESPQKDLKKNPEEAKSSPSSKKRHHFSRKRSKTLRGFTEINNCSICSQVFSTDVELAAHIYLHTESELQRAYAIAKKKKEVDMQAGGDKSERVAIKESVTEKTNETSSKTTDVAKKSPTVNETRVDILEVLIEQNPLNSEMRIPREEATDPLAITKPSSNQSESRQTVPSAQSSMDKEKINKAASIKRGFAICKCHNRSENSENCLQIEIVLLCHTCRVLFRSMECFETHYRLPGSTLCSQNRLESGRSPNLFCATCGMIFSSVQDVRHHLQMHARFKQSCTMDFRCNICKVIFIGIGSLFYIHWSKHSKDPFWMASEQSFPKISVINSKAKKLDTKPGNLELNPSSDMYIQVAEHICWNCKLPFVTEDDLKKHAPKCSASNSMDDIIVEKIVTPNAVAEKQPMVHLICSACDATFPEKIEFYTHMRSEHNFVCEPQFVCVSLTSIKRAFICSICMDISDGIDQFEEHWVKHGTQRLNFACSCCGKCCGSLKILLEHVKKHESITAEDTLLCKVNYQQADFICRPCNIGFHSQTSFNEHAVIHKLRCQMLKRKGSKESSQRGSASTSMVNDVSGSSTSKEKGMDSSKEVDREMLINILEGKGDESESDSTVDLTGLPEEPRENKEKQVVSTSKPNEANALVKSIGVQTPFVISAVSNGVAQASGSLAIPTPSKSTSTSTPGSLDPSLKASVNDGYVSCESVSDSSDTQSIVSASKEELVSKKAGLANPKQRFLRVKTLAELVGNKDTQELSKAYGCTFEGPNILRNNKNTAQGETPATKLSSQQPSNSEKNNPTKHLQSNTPLKRSLLSSALSSPPAYHKNLPACNIVRTNIAIPRSALIRIGKTAKAASKSSVQNAQETRPATCSANESSESPPVTDSNATTSLNSSLHTGTAVGSSTRYTCESYGGNVRYSMPEISNVYSSYKNQSVEQSTKESGNNAGNAKDSSKTMDQNCKESTQATPSEPGAKQASPGVFYPYPNLSSSNLSNSNQWSVQNQQINQPVAGSTPPSFYYKNSTAGGMSIVINQTTPAVQNMPTIGILPQQPPQSQMYQPLLYSNPGANVNPYMQQSQNEVSGYQVAPNPYDASVGGTIMTYAVTLQPTSQLICPYCPKTVSFISEELLQLHIDSSHVYDCSICSQRFYTFTDLTIHRSKHRLM